MSVPADEKYLGRRIEMEEILKRLQEFATRDSFLAFLAEERGIFVGHYNGDDGFYVWGFVILSNLKVFYIKTEGGGVLQKKIPPQKLNGLIKMMTVGIKTVSLMTSCRTWYGEVDEAIDFINLYKKKRGEFWEKVYKSLSIEIPKKGITLLELKEIIKKENLEFSNAYNDSLDMANVISAIKGKETDWLYLQRVGRHYYQGANWGREYFNIPQLVY